MWELWKHRLLVFWDKPINIPNHDECYSPIMVFRFSTTGSATQCLRSLCRWALTTPTLPSADTAKGASAESDSSTASDSDSPAQKSTVQGVTQQPHVMIWDNAPRFSFSNQHEIKTDPIYILGSYSWSYHFKCSNIPNCLCNLLPKWISFRGDDFIITWFHFYRY